MEAFAEKLENAEHVKTVQVTLTNDLVHLLSDQLYQSPIKAIEELVVNSFDANASHCWIALPDDGPLPDYIAVLDDGDGMDVEGLTDLWRIGGSHKRDHPRKRKQIGKFGIGKLATYALARKVTWISKTASGVYGVTIDYAAFSSIGPTTVKPVPLDLNKLKDAEIELEPFKTVLSRLGLNASTLKARASWTLVVMEIIRPEKWADFRFGRLRWVLSTAMPLRADFSLFLNQDQIRSSKAQEPAIVSFTMSTIGVDRIKDIEKALKEAVSVVGDAIVTKSFPDGVSGTVEVYKHSLIGKSDDLGRSGGFFIRTHDRLINEEDPLFGLSALTHKVFNRFRAELTADDLDQIITAPRESVGATPLRAQFQILIREVYNEARERYEAWLRELNTQERFKPEHERNRVSPDLVQFPVSDALSMSRAGSGADADRQWFYLDMPSDADRDAVLRDLNRPGRWQRFKYSYANGGTEGRMVRFEPVSRRFVLNLDHEFVAAYEVEDDSRTAIEDVATAEVLLEVYLFEAQVNISTIGQILERRDALFRALATDHPRSSLLIAQKLREAGDDERELEMLFVAAARAVGFIAKHIAGAGEPDGVARYKDYPGGERLIILEAKSSRTAPSLSALDFATLARHRDGYNAEGVWLIAPRYPGSDDNAAAATMAVQQKVSCWSVNDVARVVEAVNRRHISARQVLDIVLKHFAPDAVASAVDELLIEPRWDQRALYSAILSVLREFEDRATDSPRSVPLILGRLLTKVGFEDIREGNVRRALADLGAASQGFALFNNDALTIFGGLEEFERRVSSLVPGLSRPRGQGGFRE